jgi:hypothetical protein
LAIVIKRAAVTAAMIDLCDFLLSLKRVERYSAAELGETETRVASGGGKSETETEGEERPWEKQEISRATWFRRQQAKD